MSTTITNLPETSKVNGSDYLVLDQSDKTVKSTVSNFLTDTGVVLATQLKDTDGAELIGHRNATVGTTLDSIAVRSDQFSSLQEWASYPAKHKTLAGGTYTLDSTLSVECESLTTEGVVTINASGSFIAMYFGTNQRDLLTTLSSDISKG